MREVGTFEAKNKLSALLDLVDKGEEIAITRNGRRIARLVKDDGGPDARTRAREAAIRLGELSKGFTLDGISIRSLIDEGRR